MRCLGLQPRLGQLTTFLGAWGNNWNVGGIARTSPVLGWMHFPAGPGHPAPVGCLDGASSRWQKCLCVPTFTAGNKFLEGIGGFGHRQNSTERLIC